MSGPLSAGDGSPEPGEWHRFHPLTPLLRGGITLIAILAWVVSQQFDRWFGNDGQIPEGTPPSWTAGGVAVVLAAVVVAGWLSWRVSRFRIGSTTLELRTGLLFRQHRQVRYDRIQSVDLRRPLLARLIGLAEVRVQAAGGADADARLSFLGEARAREIRAVLMDLAGRGDEAHEGRPEQAGGEAAQDSAAQGGAVEAIVRVPNARQVQAALYSGSAAFSVLALLAIVVALGAGLPGVIPVAGPALLGVGGNHLRSLLATWNFELVRDRDGIRARRGLAEVVSSSVPVHRIQVVAVRQQVFWRLTGWWRVEVNVAGVGPGTDHTASVMLPVGTRTEALRVVEVLQPGADLALLAPGLLLGAEHPAYTAAPSRAAWVSPVVRTRQGYAVGPRGLFVTGGRLRRHVEVVPHARIQSLALQQGPLQRRLGLASVHLLSTPGASDPWVRQLRLEDAQALLNEQVARSSRARSGAAPPSGSGYLGAGCVTGAEPMN